MSRLVKMANRIALLGQSLTEPEVHLCSIIVDIPILTLHRIELLQIGFAVEFVQFDLHPMEELLCALFDARDGLSCQLAVKGCDVGELGFRIDVIAQHGSEQAKSLPIFFFLK